MTNSVISVESEAPPTMTTPMEARASAPAPVEMASGAPMMVAMEVIRMGLSRITEASSSAS